MKSFSTISISILILIAFTAPLYAQWTPSPGPLGGDVQAFVYTTGTILAGTAGGGVFRQSNGRWVYSSNGLDKWGMFVSDFARVDSAVFAATFGGVYKTTDDGQSWFPSGNGLPKQAVHAIERHNGILYAGLDSGGVFRSSDLGNTWVAANGALLTYIPVTKLSFLGEYVLAGTAGDGVHFTDNYGILWTKLDTGVPQFSEYILSLHAVAGRVYAGIYSYGIYYLPLTGGGWQPANTGLLNSSVYAFTALSTTFYCGTEDGVHYSTNWGESWTPANTGMRNKRVRALVADGVDILAGTYGGGIYRQNTPWGTWQLQNNGLTASVVSELAVTDPYDGCMYASTFGLGLHRRDTLGGGWVDITPQFLDGAMEVNRMYNRGDTIYLATNGGVYFSADRGTTWNHLDWGMSASPITALAFDHNGLVAATWYNGVYQLAHLNAYWNKHNYGLPTANGTTFAKINDLLFYRDSLYLTMEPNFIFRRNSGTLLWDSLRTTGLALSRILRLAVNDSILYAMGYNGLFFTSDHGATWAPDTTGLGGVVVRGLRIAKDNPQAFGYYAHLISEDGRLFFQDSAFGRWREEPLNGTGFMVDMLSDSQNSFASFYGRGIWTTNPFPVELSVFSGYAVDASTNMLEWQTESEINNRGFDILRSFDGTTWERRGFVAGAGTSTQREFYTYTDLAARDCLYRLRQVDFDGTVSHSPIVEVRKHTQPGDYALEAWPNPVSDAATVSFTVLDGSPTTIRISDVMGRTAFEHTVEKPAGSRVTLRWNAASSAIPPGTYILMLSGTDGTLKASRRIIVKK